MFIEPPDKIPVILATKIADEKPLRSQASVADGAGISPTHLIEMKQGKKQINTSHLFKLSKTFNCYPSDLLPPSWIRPDSKTDSARIEKAFEIVVKSYIENIAEHGTSYITPSELAKVASVLIDDLDNEFNTSNLKKTINLAKKFK